MSGSIFGIWFWLIIGLGFLAIAGMVFAVAYLIYYMTTKNKRNM